MKVGVTGHQKRPEIDWVWVRHSLEAELLKLGQIEAGYSSLALGADQVFAEALIKRQVRLIAVIPLANYEGYFKGSALADYQKLFAQSEHVFLPEKDSAQESFFQAGKYIADHSDVIIAVWDGKPSQGWGGTADIVNYTLGLKKKLIHIDVAKKRVRVEI